MSRAPREINKLFVKSMHAISGKLEKPVCEISKPQFFAHNEENISEWDLRKAGGFDALKKLHFVPEDNLEAKYGSRLVRSHITKLEREYGRQAFIDEELLKSIGDIISSNPLRVHPKVKPAKTKKKVSRTLLAHLSDTHYGSNIDEKEMGGINRFSWTVAARRTALFMKQIAEYKPQYRAETDVVLAVNGDLVQGVIHDQEFVSDLWAVQFAGTLDIMVQAITYLANHFRSVKVEWTTGNHDRVMHKSNKGRASTKKWDSLGNTIAVSTKRVVEATHQNVKFNIPLTPYNISEIHGHLFLVSHGDTFFRTGNVGSSINMKALNTQIAKLNASELGGGKKFAGVLVGHVHTNTVQLTESGCVLLINGCLSGTDGFAQSIGIFESHPAQQLVEVTAEHAVGDIRMIQLKGADADATLDSIIKPFEGNLG